MSVTKIYEYHKGNDEVLKPSSNVQVVMAHGLFSNWHQPIFFDFDTQLRKGTLINLIKRLHSVGFEVRAMTCDLGSGNQALFNELGVSIERSFFLNPVDKEPVYVFSDAPHDLKLIRNHLIDDGFIVEKRDEANKKS